MNHCLDLPAAFAIAEIITKSKEYFDIALFYHPNVHEWSVIDLTTPLDVYYLGREPDARLCGYLSKAMLLNHYPLKFPDELSAVIANLIMANEDDPIVLNINEMIALSLMAGEKAEAANDVPG